MAGKPAKKNYPSDQNDQNEVSGLMVSRKTRIQKAK